MAFSLTGTSSNNAVGYEKHHHKHLGWSTLCHIKNQRALHLYPPFDKASCLLLYLLSDQPDLSLSYDHNTTSDISSSPVRSALITPEPGSDLTSLPDLQLLPPLCKAPSCGLSSVAKSFGRQLWRTYSTQPKKVCVKRTERRVLPVKQRKGEQGVHQSCFIKCLKGNNTPFFPFFVFTTLSLPATHSYSHKHTLEP